VLKRCAVFLNPLTPLVVFALATATALCASAWVGIPPAGDPLLQAVLRIGWAVMLVLWMDADARRLRRLPCYDFGLLAGAFFPLSLLWYCWWSRRWRGLLVLLLLLALWFVPQVVAGFLWLARYALAGRGRSAGRWASSKRCSRRAAEFSGSMRPNQALQQTGHATDGAPRYTSIPREPAAELCRSALAVRARC